MTAPTSPFYDPATDPVHHAIRAALGDVDPDLIVEAARAAREACARIILDHADRHCPRDGNHAQKRLRRHYRMAAGVVGGKPTAKEAVAAFTAMITKDPAP